MRKTDRGQHVGTADASWAREQVPNRLEQNRVVVGERVNAGDGAAGAADGDLVAVRFSEFVRAARPGLVRYAALLCGSSGLADDLVQEVLVRIHRKWNAIEGSPQAYARSAVTREFLSWRRAPARRQIPMSQSMPDAAVQGDFDDGPDPAVWAAVQALPPQQRAAVFLRFYLDQSDAQIAAAIGCRANTVRTHVSRALAVLRGVMGDSRRNRTS